MRSVLIVETPLQLLNAVEAKNSLDLGECVLVLLVSKSFPQSTFDPLVRIGAWTRVEILRLQHKFEPVDLRWLGRSVSLRLNEYAKESKQFLNRLKFDRLSKKLGRVDNLVLGNLLQGYMQHFANRVRAKRIVLLDDGTDTLRVCASRNVVERGPASGRVTFLRRTKDYMRKAFVDWDLTRIRSLTFFTSYDLTLPAEDSAVGNRYAFWRQRLKSVAREDVVYFLGQPLVEDGYLTLNAYLNALAKVIAHYQGERFLYLTHRREADTKLAAVRAMGISVESFDLPIELQMLNVSTPRELSSFFSSALDNCRIIWGESLKVTAFRLSESEFSPGCDFVGHIYDYLCARIGPTFRVVDLRELATGA